MLAIISDLHLTDGSGAVSVPTEAIQLLTTDLRRLAASASWRADGRYRPVEQVDVLLLGDVFDMRCTTQWAAHPDVRPWDSPERPALIDLLGDITAGIVTHNEAALTELREFATPGRFTLPPADSQGRPVSSAAAQPVAVRLHYVVGDHDWFFSLPGAAWNDLRRAVVSYLGLCHAPDQPFAHDPIEYEQLGEVLQKHRVVARHGDVFDPLNFSGQRAASSLGDALAIELLNQFPDRVFRVLGDAVPMATLVGLSQLAQLRPLLLAGAWIENLVERTCPAIGLRQRIQHLWSTLVDDLLDVPFVGEQSRQFGPQFRDELRLAFQYTSAANRTIPGLRSRLGTAANRLPTSYFRHALAEPDFRNRRARFVVYGHSHQAESLPLETSHYEQVVLNQAYFNTGTWQRVWRPTASTARVEFVPHDAVGWLVIYQGDERQGRMYESWSGTLGVRPTDAHHFRRDAASTTLIPTPHVAPSIVSTPAPHFANFAAGPIRPTRRQR